MPELPLLACDGCGGCCFEQPSPPGYGRLAAAEWADPSPDRAAIVDRGLDDSYLDPEAARADADRWRSMPAALRDDLRSHFARIAARAELPGEAHGPCRWLDPTSRRCRHYDWRPAVCRDFRVGNEACLDWREWLGVGPSVASPSP